MNTIDLRATFAKIYQHLQNAGAKPTAISKQIGFTTTTQLKNVLEGKSHLSDKAIIGLIKNLNVNPMYLFLSSGDMFLTDEDELTKIRKENHDLKEKLEDCDRKYNTIKQLLSRELRKNDQLQEVNAAVIELYKNKLSVYEKPDDDLLNIPEVYN